MSTSTWTPSPRPPYGLAANIGAKVIATPELGVTATPARTSSGRTALLLAAEEGVANLAAVPRDLDAIVLWAPRFA